MVNQQGGCEVAPVPGPRKAPGSRTSIALGALAVVYLLVRAWNLTAFCLDWDEVFSVTSARLASGGLVSALVHDLVHPPLFYFLLKGWIGIGGTSLVWIRLLPFTLSALALIPLLLIFRRLDLGPAARILSFALIAVNDCQVSHARYVRMYGLLFLLSLVSLYLFLAWMEDGGKRRLAALTGANILLVYTHYYGWLLVLAEVLALALWRRRKLKECAFAVATVLVAFAPWAIAVMHSAGAKGGFEPNLRWIRRPGVGDLLWFYAGLNGPLAPIPLASLVALIVLAVLAAGLPRVFRDARLAQNTWRPGLLAIACALPPVVSFAASNVLAESVWGVRHLILAAVPYMVLLAVSMSALRPARLRHAAMALMAVWLAWGAWRAVFVPEPQVNLEVLVRQLVERSGSERQVTVYSLDGYLPAWMGYYLEPRRRSEWNVIGIRAPGEVAGDRFWLAYNEKFWRAARRPEDMLRDMGYNVGPGIWAADQWNRIVFVPVQGTKNKSAADKRR